MLCQSSIGYDIFRRCNNASQRAIQQDGTGINVFLGLTETKKQAENAYRKTGGKISGEVICPQLTIDADVPYVAGFTNGERQFFCGRASDGPLYLKNDTTDALLRITDHFYFNNKIIPNDYSNFDQRYQIYGQFKEMVFSTVDCF
ncbi:hypothetical protein XBP1_2820056 [Xenorhabdus bovienii str. puntauvense]|uniref:Uncharacterized protein n=2 Tax=Xenorhabdus bovienii TaxID=40576 RepID=A0A077NHD8_XENBV|nr:hypothetical protein XBP1_2820056 [Xenorhabdus bovienii str. puntauvense]